MKSIRFLFINNYTPYQNFKKFLSQSKQLSQITNMREQMDNSRRLPLTILNDDEILMRDTVSKLAREQILPYVKQMDENNSIDDNILKLLFENGLMGIEVDTQHGGSNCNFLTSMLIVEELSKVDAAVAALVDIHNTLVINFLMKLGNPQQKQQYLPQLTTQCAGSFCLSEPQSGSDAFSLKTVAKQDGDDYLITGTKMWISNSDIAKIFLVFANVNLEKKYKGITCFIVERDTPGFIVGKKEDKLGIRASGTCMLHFDNVRVHKSQILGEIGHGYKYAAKFLNEGRIGIASQMVGIAQGCFDVTIPYTLERKQFNTSIFDFQGMQYQIAEIATEIEAARLLTYNSARLLEMGHHEGVVKEAAMAKYFAAQVAQRTTSQCINWMGGVGFTKDFPQEKFYRDAKIGSIYEGTNNMQLSTIAKHIRKLYLN